MSHISRGRALALLVTGAVLLAGCAAGKRSPVEPPEGWGPAPQPVAAAIDRMLFDTPEVTTYRALFKTRLRKGIEQQQITQSVTFAYPDRLRVDTFATGLNQLAHLLIVSGEDLYAYDTAEHTVYHGLATARLLERLLSVPFAPNEMMRWLSGTYSPPSLAAVVRKQYSATAGSTAALATISLLDGRTIRLEFSVTPATFALRMTSLKIFRTGDTVPLFTTEYVYSGADSSALQAIQFALPEPGVSGTMTIVEVKENPDLANSDRLFSLPPNMLGEAVEL